MLKQEIENKKKQYAIIKNNSNVSLHGLKPGAEIKVKVDSQGTPKEMHWRRRKKDSCIDGCIDIKLFKDKKIENKEAK